MLENKLGITNEIELLKEEERITKLKAIELFDSNKINEFEIYASLSGEEDDFRLAVTGSHTTTGNMMEFKFDTIQAKKIKFVFKSANQDWASAAEFWFYKEDALLNQMNHIFTNESKNELTEEFNTIEKLNEFEVLAQQHPFYDDFLQIHIIVYMYVFHLSL